MSRSIKFKILADDLRCRIVAGEIPVGSMIPSELQLIEQYQVSRLTVREAINLLVSEGYLLKKRGRFCGTTVLERNEEQKRIRRSVNFGIFGSEHIFNPLINDAPAVEYGIVNGLTKWNATLSLFPFLSRKFPGALPFAKEMLPRNLVDGLFVFNTSDRNEFIEYLLQMKVPTVFLCAGHLFDDFSNDVSLVHIQEQLSIDKFAMNLKKKGYEKIVLLGGFCDFNHRRTNDFFKNAARESGLAYHAENCSDTGFAEFAEKLSEHSNGTTAVVSSNELVEKITIALDFLKLVPKKDIYITLFQHYSPDWSTLDDRYGMIVRPYRKMGETAAKIMRNLYKAKISGMPFPVERVALESSCPNLKDIPVLVKKHKSSSRIKS